MKIYAEFEFTEKVVFAPTMSDRLSMLGMSGEGLLVSVACV